MMQPLYGHRSGGSDGRAAPIPWRQGAGIVAIPCREGITSDHPFAITGLCQGSGIAPLCRRNRRIINLAIGAFGPGQISIVVQRKSVSFPDVKGNDALDPEAADCGCDQVDRHDRLVIVDDLGHHYGRASLSRNLVPGLTDAVDDRSGFDSAVVVIRLVVQIGDWSTGIVCGNT